MRTAWRISQTRYIPVSYTHLDVYKRQIVKLITHGDFTKEELDIYAVGATGEELLTSKGYHIAVSYTHLDVYKRQGPRHEVQALCAKG